jgi:hypothetical protein
MKKLKITGLASILFLSTMLIASCDKENEDEATVYTNNNIQLKASNVVVTPNIVLPPTVGKGTMQASYDKSTKLLSYTITWDTLTTAPIAIHIHGITDSGLIALPSPLGPYGIDSFRVSQTPAVWVKYVGGIAQKVNLPTTPAPKKAGSLTGQLFVDEIVIKETDLLDGKFYVDIHTSSSPLFIAFGEIRGQITFPRQ